MKRVIEDIELRTKLANNLHEFVKDKYNLEHLTNERIDIYNKLIDENKMKREELMAAIQKV